MSVDETSPTNKRQNEEIESLQPAKKVSMKFLFFISIKFY